MRARTKTERDAYLVGYKLGVDHAFKAAEKYNLAKAREVLQGRIALLNEAERFATENPQEIESLAKEIKQRLNAISNDQ